MEHTEMDTTTTTVGAAERLDSLRSAIGEAMVGQSAVIDQVLVALVASGHALIEGVPGLGKTLLVRALAQALALAQARVQFTPDMMPSDITGHAVLDPNTRELRVVRGPVFTQLLLADEINRAPAKTQSALLEVMQEYQVTLEGQTQLLPQPFFVLATQNPVETEGTYPLPEAQLDRFLLKIRVTYPSREEELEIARRQTTDYSFIPSTVLSADDMHLMQTLVRAVVVSEHVYSAALDLVRTTRPEEGALPRELQNMVQWGAGPRATIALLMAAKARALVNRRCHATTSDLRAVALPVLRHRIILTFNAEAAGVDADSVLNKIVQETRSLATT